MVDASLCACEMWWNFCNVKRVVLLQKNAVDGDDDGIFREVRFLWLSWMR